MSEDCKKVRCKICGPLCTRQNATWIKKDSLAYHLKSDLHARSIIAQQDRESLRTAGEQSMQEESTMEESMNFVVLSSTSIIEARGTEIIGAHRPSVEEKDMWDNHQFANVTFDAGKDHASAAVEERRRLEREANDFDLWHGADYIPEEDPNDSELLLDELEQDDILTELLRNASMCVSLIVYMNLIHFWIDTNTSDAVDLLEKEAEGQAKQTKVPDSWSPYESKLVRPQVQQGCRQ